VVDNSIARAEGSMDVRFTLTDEAHMVPVVYSGILPDLFREGQGIIAHGRMQGGEFVADEILAKHDENYMPPEVAASLDHTRSQQPSYGAEK
jgi:cytochrome c-type biogenesis protein CcmE